MIPVLIDVDGTLMPGVNAERLFVRYLLRRQVFGIRQITAFIAFAPCYGIRLGHHVFKKNKAYLSGFPVTVVEDWAAGFVDRILLQRVSRTLYRRLQQHRQQGDVLVLLTGTPDFIARPLAARLAIPYVIATVCDRQSGRFTARPPRFHPFAEAKVKAALEFCQIRGLSLQDCIAYADSIHDLPLLERVGQAVAVAPDSALDRRASQCGWEILTI